MLLCFLFLEGILGNERKMVDIHITYEALFDILRKERSLEDIQELDSQFWSHVVSYLQERKAFLEQTSLAEQEKTKLQLDNIKRILKELYEHRERKIISLARTVVRMGAQDAADDRNMLPEEKFFFKDCLSLFSKYRTSVLLNVCNAQLPDFDISSSSLASISNSSSHSDSATSSQITSNSFSQESSSTIAQQTSSSPSKDTTTVAEQEEAVSQSTPQEELSSSESADEQTQTSQSNTTPTSQPEVEESETLVKFIVDVPKFAGRNKQLFGPFEKGVIASLPEQIANILLKKQKVEFVLAMN